MRPLLAVAAVCVALTTCSGCRNAGTRNFESVLAEIDADLGAGAIERAAELVPIAANSASSFDNWMRLTKRAYSISETSGDWRLLNSTASDAFKALPGRLEFSAIRAYSYLKWGYAGKAQSIAREYLDGSEWQSIADEAFLATGGDLSVRGGLSAYREYRPEFDAETAKFFEESAHRLGGESRLSLDAALVYAAAGDVGEAASLVGGFAPDFPLAAAYLSYDQGDFARSLRFFDRYEAGASEVAFRDYLAHADAFRAAGDDGKAAAVYRRLIESFPGETWLSYANLALYLSQEGKASQARSAIDQGLDRFPDSLPLIATSIQMHIASNEGAAAAAQAETLRAKHPEAPETAYLAYEISRSPASRMRLVAYLKDAFYAHPRDSELARNVAAVLTNDRNYRDLALVLDQYESVSPPADWSILYRAMLAVHEGDLEAALRRFDDAERLSSRWEYLYDSGLVLSALGRYEQAREMFRRAGSISGSPSERARITVEIARAFYREGNRSAAVREASYALDIDSEQTEARLLLRELDAGAE